MSRVPPEPHPPHPSAQAELAPFATFALLYMTAIFLELSEHWTHPLFTLAVLGLITVLVLTRLTRVTFLVFLTVTTTYFLGVRFPEVANHVNLIIYCNVLMMSGIIYSLVRRRGVQSDGDWFVALRPLLQVTLCIVYFMAGFHKLNADFVNPAVSCVTGTMTGLWDMVRSNLLGLPTIVVLGVGIAAASYLLLAPSPLRRYLPLIGGGALGVGLLALLLGPRVAGELAPLVGKLAVTPMVGLVFVWELAGGLLLLVPPLQLPVLLFSWTMHATLALIGFVDFGSLALALLFTFVPAAYQKLMGGPLRLPVGNLSLRRPQLYFALCLAAGFIGVHSRLAAGIMFNVAALVLIWPLLFALVGRPPRPAWPGVPVKSRLTPRWLYVFPVLLLLYASTSYLGLRTAGNFSMFSNLRTEGDSNHLLLGSNPLKIWGYQEDVVRFIHIDDREAEIGHQYQPLQGRLLPVVEFRKLIYKWTRAGATIPLTFEYRGVVHSTPDVVNDPAWRTPARDLEMILLDFRSIQPAGPNLCRW